MHKFNGYSTTYIVIFMNLSADVVCILYRTEETGFIERMLFLFLRKSLLGILLCEYSKTNSQIEMGIATTNSIKRHGSSESISTL